MKKGVGCGTLFSFIIVIGLISLLVQYWWVVLALLIVGIIILALTKISSAHTLSKPNQSNEVERTNTHRQNDNTYAKKALPKEVIHNKKPTEWNVIPYEILDLLWFYDGPRKNMEDSEPSAISIKLPISHGKPEPLPYWPSYVDMSAEQRGTYLNWLKDISKPIDIGYVFTFFYGLERQILMGNIDATVNVIRKLKKYHSQSSFNSYSDNTLIFAALKKQDSEILQYVDPHTHNLIELILSKGYFSNKLSSDDIMRISKDVGFTNQRYIKMYPKIFVKNIAAALIEKFDNPFFEIPRNLSNVPMTTIFLSNVRLGQSQIDHEESGVKVTFSVNVPLSIDIPDFSQAAEIKQPLLQVLKTAHSKTKIELQTMRKDGQNIPSNLHKATPKTINGRTGYPMSTEKSIRGAQEQLELLKETQNLNSKMSDTDLKYFEGDLFYKKGDWDKAEKAWLISINSMPDISGEKLAIMYRKQKKYNSEIEIINNGLIIAKSLSGENALTPRLTDRLPKAQAYKAKHHN